MHSGPMGAGSLMEITAVPDIREQCATVARQIAATATGGAAATFVGSGRVARPPQHLTAKASSPEPKSRRRRLARAAPGNDPKLARCVRMAFRLRPSRSAART